MAIERVGQRGERQPRVGHLESRAASPVRGSGFGDHGDRAAPERLRANDAPSAFDAAERDEYGTRPCLPGVVCHRGHPGVADRRVAHTRQGRCAGISRRRSRSVTAVCLRPAPADGGRASGRRRHREPSSVPAAGDCSITKPSPLIRAVKPIGVSVRSASRALRPRRSASARRRRLRRRRDCGRPARPRVAAPDLRRRVVARHHHRRRRVQRRADAQVPQRRLGDALEDRRRDARAVIAVRVRRVDDDDDRDGRLARGTNPTNEAL